MLKSLGAMDGQNEVSVTLGGKKHTPVIFYILTYPIAILSLAGLPSCSFIQHTYTELLLYA